MSSLFLGMGMLQLCCCLWRVRERSDVPKMNEGLFWGPYTKLCRPGVLWMKHIFPCFTPFWIALVESPRGTVSLPRLAMLSTRCFSLKQETLDTHITGFDWFLPREGDSTALQINYHSCFHNRWPNSKIGRIGSAYGFGMTWGWVINDRIFILGWTMPLKPTL